MVTMTVQDTAPATIEATLNYLQDTGVMPSVFTGGPGSTDVRAASPSDPHRVTMHNGRLESDGFMLDRQGFRFVGHDTNEDAFPMLNPDGPFCLTRPGVYTVLVSVEKGGGHYAIQVWGF